MASAQRRSGTRGRPPPKRWVLTCSGMSGFRTAHRASEMRKPVVVRLFGVRARVRGIVDDSFMPIVYRVIRIGSKSGSRAKLCQNMPVMIFQGVAVAIEQALPVEPF